MLPYSFIGGGTYTSTGSAFNVALNDQPDWFFVKDLTNWGKATTADAAIYAEWFSSMALGSYLGLGQPSSTGAGITTYATQGASNGFTFINSAKPPLIGSLAGTAITNTTFVDSMANTGSIAVGDIVRLINPTGMQQLGGIVTQVTAVTSNMSITFGYIATAVAAGLVIAAPATTNTVLKFYPGQFYPRAQQILYITQATQAKVYFARPNTCTPGQLVDFTIPSTYGTAWAALSYATRRPGGAYRVLSVTNTATESSIVLNLNTSGIGTAFAYPSSATAAGMASPPICEPAGSGIVPLNGSATIPQTPPGTNLQDAFDNLNQYYMNIGSSVVGASGSTMQYFAFKADYLYLSNA
jgi:hypothetical protein